MDTIYFDDASTDNSSRYHINSTYGTSLTYSDGYYQLNTGTNANYVDLRTLTNSIKGKTVTFEVDIITNGASVRLQISGNTTILTGSYSSESGTFKLENVEIPSNTTSSLFRIGRQSPNDGNCILFKNFKVYVS